jgi:hypothetical protein
VIGHGVKNRDRRLPCGIHQSDGVVYDGFHALLRLLWRAVVVNVEQVEEKKAGFLGIELVNVHGLDLRWGMGKWSDGILG